MADAAPAMANEEPITGTSVQDFIADSDITSIRPPTSLVNRLTQLTALERHGLRHHLRYWVKVVDEKEALASELNITPDHQKRFNEKLFDDWSSLLGFQEMESIPIKKRTEESRLKVSTWSQDLPLSGAAKRKRGDDGEDEDDEYDDDDDEDEVPSSKRTKTEGAAKAAALIHHDKHEYEYIRTFNEELILTSARNYIVEASKVGIKNPDDLEVQPPVVPELRQPTSAVDLLIQVHKHYAHVIKGIDSLKAGQVSG
ncbi:hypothetical protein ACHAPO_002474 [Fusarium lateritium]